MEAAHLLPAADVLRRFSVTAEGGLSPEQVTGARERYGPNGERGPAALERRCCAWPGSRPLPHGGRAVVSLPAPRSGGRPGSQGSGSLSRCSRGTRRGHLRGAGAGSGLGNRTPAGPLRAALAGFPSLCPAPLRP